MTQRTTRETAAGSTLLLSHEDLRHFAEHGWVLIEGVFDEAECEPYIRALDRLAGTRRPVEASDSPDLTTVDNLLLYDDVFVHWLKTPGILDAARQIVGARIHLQSTVAHIKLPHPDRHTRPDELYDPDTWGWHRGMRPKWGIFPHDNDPELLNCAMIHVITYLTPVAPRSGSTVVLDGSHLREGSYRSLKDECPVVEIPASPAGSVLIFSETLVHTGVPILSETTRYNIYYAFTPHWLAEWPQFGVPQELVERYADPEIRDVLCVSSYRGQYDPLSEPPAEAMPRAHSM